MKKNQLKSLIKESLLEGGYSNYYPGGKTPGLSTDVLNKILLRIAQGKGTEESYEGDPDKGNKILDTANQDNVDKILRGEDPHISRMQELAGLKQEIKINKPGLPTEEEYMELFSNIYEDIDHADVNDILEKYVPEEIMDDHEIGQIEFFQYVPDDKKRILMDELQAYYNDEINSDGSDIEEIKINKPNPKLLTAINNYIKTWEDDEMLEDANLYFPTIPDITENDFIKFFENYMDDMSELSSIKKAWKNIQKIL